MFTSIKSYFFARAAEDDKVENSSEMKPTGPKSPLYGQTVKFLGTDEQHSTEIISEDVRIIASQGTHDKGSSCVKTKNIVDHSWDVRFYKGQLLAVHMAGKFIAFGLQVVSKGESMVRIVNRESNHRYLCKGMTGLVQDIAFAHIPSQVLLGIVDETGGLFVHRIQDGPKGIKLVPVVQIIRTPNPSRSSVSHRLIWCPYIPEEDGDCTKDTDYEDMANMLVVTHGPQLEVWNVGMVVQAHGSGKELNLENVKDGMITFDEHTLDIVDAAFSPDGTAVATASLDGSVKFFQVYIHGEGKPRILHMWQPHDGKPLSSLFFLDNHRTYNPDAQFWKYAVTGCDNNSELKIWSCESWKCLQTIHFIPNPSSGQESISLKAGIDLSADFIMLSDINNRVLYVLQLQKDVEESTARVCAVSEFTLPNPILSFGIVDAGVRYIKCHHDGDDDLETELDDNSNSDGGEDEDEEEEKSLQVVVRMYVVHPKSLKGCIITFDPPKEAKKTISILSQDTLRFDETAVVPTLALKEFSEGLSDISDNVLENISHTPLIGNNHSKDLVDISQPPQSMIHLHSLMTPDDFSSSNEKDPGKGSAIVPVSECSAERSNDHSGLNTTERSAEKSRPQADATSELDAASNTLSKSKGKISGKAMNDPSLKRSREPTASGGSSPSREVEEILSHGSSDRLSSTMSFGFPSATIPEDVATVASAPPVPAKVPSPRDRELVEASLKLDMMWNDGQNQEKKTLGEKIVTGNEAKIVLTSADSSSSICSPHPATVNASMPVPLLGPMPAAAITSATSALQAVVAAAQEKPIMVTAEQLEKQQTQWSRVDLLLETLHQQQEEIKSLRHELSTLRIAQTSSVDVQTSGHLETLLRSHQQQQEAIVQMKASMQNAVQTSVQNVVQSSVQTAVQNALQSVMRQRDQQEAQRQEALISAVTQTIGNMVTSQLPLIISQEMKSEVVPLVKTTMQQVKHQMATEVATKLSASDHLMKENIAKLVSNKTIMDMLSQSLVTMSQSTVHNLCKESLSSLVPTMEKITQNMFLQINSSFSKGTQEYMQYVDSNLEKQRRQSESTQQMLLQMQALTEKLASAHEQQNVMLKSTLENQLQRLLNSLHDKLNKTVSETVKGNLAQGFKQQKAVIEESVLTSLTAVRSRAVSPAHSVSDYAVTERQILQHIQDGELNLAFQQALSAANINLVLLVCDRVDPQVLFTRQPFPLKQNILLSLIQQLSVDLTDHTDLKRRYLEEAVMSLDPMDHDVQKHMYIITSLQETLMKYMRSNPNSPMTRQMKMLWMATGNFKSAVAS